MALSLNILLAHIQTKSSQGDLNKVIDTLFFDSRLKVTNGLFFAVKGTQSDGHTYIEQAIKQGAIAIVCENLPKALQADITYIQVHDSAFAMGHCASVFYGEPSKQLKLVGITGTNGKTTTVTLLHKLFGQLGYLTGLLSTIQNQIGDNVLPATHTTPDAITLNRLLREMADEGCTHAFMEVSSHAVVQQRIAGLHFSGAIFSNITHDHLDFHLTFDAYIKAKKGFFDGLSSDAFALTNVDDKNGKVMLQNTAARKYTYGLKSFADFKCRLIENSLSGLHLQMGKHEVWCRLIGEFNAYNLTAIYATAVLLGEDPEQVLTLLSNLSSAEGRFDYIESPSHVIAVIDYAHTPDALKNVLKTLNDIRQHNEEKLITVVGCGGDRDTTKRPVMAKIACQMSDQLIITSDNPRTEDPDAIIRQMMEGIDLHEKKQVLTITNREDAIKTACIMARPGDMILVAGKGHEKYQEINGVKHHFDDKEILMKYLK